LLSNEGGPGRPGPPLQRGTKMAENGAAIPEAPVSWTVRYTTPEGFDAMLTLRGGAASLLFAGLMVCLIHLLG